MAFLHVESYNRAAEAGVDPTEHAIDVGLHDFWANIIFDSRGKTNAAEENLPHMRHSGPSTAVLIDQSGQNKIGGCGRSMHRNTPKIHEDRGLHVFNDLLQIVP